MTNCPHRASFTFQHPFISLDRIILLCFDIFLSAPWIIKSSLQFDSKKPSQAPSRSWHLHRWRQQPLQHPCDRDGKSSREKCHFLLKRCSRDFLRAQTRPSAVSKLSLVCDTFRWCVLPKGCRTLCQTSCSSAHTATSTVLQEKICRLSPYVTIIETGMTELALLISFLHWCCLRSAYMCQLYPLNMSCLCYLRQQLNWQVFKWGYLTCHYTANLKFF